MSGLLSLLRHRSIGRHCRPLQAQRLGALCAFWVSLALAPLSVSAQTAPVTIGVTLGTPLGSSGSGSLAIASLSASGLTSGLVFNQLVLPEAQTTLEKTSAQEGAAPELLQRPRTVGGMFRYEHIHGHQGGLNLDGNSYATNLQLAWDRDRFSFGFLLPYDFLGDFRKSFSLGGVRTSPRWGEAMAKTTPPWTTTRDVLFQKSPKSL